MIKATLTIIYIVMIISCSYVENEKKTKVFNDKGNFELYLAAFKLRLLPISIDQNYMVKNESIENELLDTAMVSKYVEANKSFAQGLSLFDVYEFRGLFKFQLGSNVAVVVQKSGGAGGVEDLYFLITYDEFGVIISKVCFAKQVGDCSRLIVQTGIINKDFILEVKNFLYKNACEDEVYDLESQKMERLKINLEDGTISQIKFDSSKE